MPEIASKRLYSLQISSQRFRTPGEVVHALGAMQAQDYSGTLWAIGLRIGGATVADIELAVETRQIARTWPMRGTLHFVAAEDIRWMLALLSPRIISGSASRYKELELDEKTFMRSYKIFEKKMSGERQLTRDEVFRELESSGIAIDKQRGYHILRRAAQDMVVCFGPPRGKQDTFVLLDEWLPSSVRLSGDEALAELAFRYFTGHGPATINDYAWWSGLRVSEAKRGLEMVKHKLLKEAIKGTDYWMADTLPEGPLRNNKVHLLPGFDEYLLGYKDRSASIDPKYAERICPGGNGMFAPTIVINGKVEGIWKKSLKKDKVMLDCSLFRHLSKNESIELDHAIEHYGTYLGMAAGCLKQKLTTR